jgi:hypothetical protein
MAHWECSIATWHEDRKPQPGKYQGPKGRVKPLLQALRSAPGYSGFFGYSMLVYDFIWREFTFEQDTIHAVSGIFAAVSTVFRGGFLFGLPETYFQIALLWSLGDTQREPQTTRKRENCRYPSWSWIAWKGTVKFRVEQDKSIQLTQWYAIKNPGDTSKRLISATGNQPSALPDDGNSDPSGSTMSPLRNEMYIACQTHTAQLSIPWPQKHVSLKDWNGRRTCLIFPDLASDALEDRKGFTEDLIDLVAIHAVRRFWGLPGGPWNEEDEIYVCAVMWIEWIGGIAYRKGIGEVRWDVWEQLQPKPIDLILG